MHIWKRRVIRTLDDQVHTGDQSGLRANVNDALLDGAERDKDWVLVLTFAKVVIYPLGGFKP